MTPIAAASNDIRKALPLGKVLSVVFSSAVFIVLLLPSVGMLWAQNTESVEKADLASIPVVVDADGSFNVNVLAETGLWFEDHYAYRPAFIDADDRLYATLFGVSPTNQVIVGKASWLYYGGTLNDFQDRAPLRPRQAYSIAHNLLLVQNYCASAGARFAFTIAPNKNTLYPQYMPKYYPRVENPSMDLLKTELDQQGVNYVDLFETLAAVVGSANAPLYFKGDSHWNEAGALIAQDAILKTVGADALGLKTNDLSSDVDYVGDLSLMLYPTSAQPELNWYAPRINDGSGESGSSRSGSAWHFLEGSSVEDALLVTQPLENAYVAEGGSAAQNGSLMMFRDSFANSLIPYLACEFSQASFSKMIPYNLLDITNEAPHVVVLERAQRHVDYLVQAAPLMPSPLVEVSALTSEDEGGTVVAADTSRIGSEAPDAVAPGAALSIEADGPLFTIAGSVGALAEDSPHAQVFVRITEVDNESETQESSGTTSPVDSLDRAYEAFLISADESDAGFAAHVSKELWQGKQARISVFVGTLHRTQLAYTTMWAFE